MMAHNSPRTTHHSKLLLIAIVLFTVIAPQPVQARPHALLLRADPADGAVIGQAARQVRLWFSAPVLPDVITLTDAQQQPVALPTAQAQVYQPAAVGLAVEFDAAFLFLCQLNPGKLPGALIIEMPQLAAGTYQLRWSALINEPGGTQFSGALAFRVEAGAFEPLAPTAPQPISLQANDLLTTLTVSPNVPGQNFVTLTVTNMRRPAPAPIERVLVTLGSPDGRQPAQQFAAVLVKPGTYQVSGTFAPSGRWQVQTRIQRPGLLDSTADFGWSVPGTSQHPLFQSLLANPVLLLATGISLACVFALLRRSIRRRNDRRQPTLTLTRDV